MSSKKDIESYVSTLSDKVRDNVEIVELRSSGLHKLLHISANKSKEYFPRIGNRQFPSEDRSVPRVTVSDSFLSCVSGYSAILGDMLTPGKNWKGGLYIHSFDVEYCLKPNKKLVPDADKFDEYWLVPYSRDSRSYKPEVVGKFIPIGFDYQIMNGRHYHYVVRGYIEVTSSFTYDDKAGLLEEGFYYTEFTHNYRGMGVSVKSVLIRPVSQAEYREKKKLVMATLSASPDKKLPIYGKW